MWKGFCVEDRLCVVEKRVVVGRGWEMHVARMGRREMCAEICSENTKHK